MGKGKGSFDHWASRIAVSKIIFEIKGDIHEQIVKDAFRLAGNKMPGMLLLSSPPLGLRLEWFSDAFARHVRIRQKGRPSCCRYHKIGRHYLGGIEEASPQDPTRRGPCWINDRDLAYIRIRINFTHCLKLCMKARICIVSH